MKIANKGHDDIDKPKHYKKETDEILKPPHSSEFVIFHVPNLLIDRLKLIFA